MSASVPAIAVISLWVVYLAAAQLFSTGKRMKMETNFKKEAALAAVPMIRRGMTVGLGAGATIGYLVAAIAEDRTLASSLTLVSSSADTIRLLQQHGLVITDAGELAGIDLYFDGCDQVDADLNAFKSGAGIHAIEKVFAFMAAEFIILADAAKFTSKLNTAHPLTMEVLPEAKGKVISTIRERFSTVTVSIRKDAGRPMLTARNNLLTDLRFETLPPLYELDQLKMLPGVIDHSLFYEIASGAIIAGEEGIQKLAQRVK